MLLGTVQISGESLGEPEVKNICDSLRDNSIRLLSLRECSVEDEDFKRLSESVRENESLVQLNLNLGICNGKNRIRWLADALMGNKSLNTLLLHGTNIGDHGIEMLLPALCSHPNLQSIDLGDCQIGDKGIQHICKLLVPSEGKSNIQDLTLSANHRVTQFGWTQLAMAIAANSNLKRLYLDYNYIGDYGAGIFSVALAANRNIEKLDLEGTGITDKGATILASNVAKYCKRLQELVLTDNPISTDLLEQINDSIIVATENGDNTETKDGIALQKGSPRINQLKDHN